jgi:hypothetical protein
MFVDMVHWAACRGSFSKKCVSLAIYCLADYLTKANVDDELVDFTHKGGWYKIDTVLCKHSGFCIIFGDQGLRLGVFWAEDLIQAAKVLKVSTSPLLCREELTLASCLQKRRPDSEAGDIMSKYAKRWWHIAKEHFYDCNITDCSAESNDESSDSDSD